MPEGRGVLTQIALRSPYSRFERVAVNAHAVDLGERLGVLPGAARADHFHPVARFGQRAALLPHTAVERNRQVLDKHQYAGTPVIHFPLPADADVSGIAVIVRRTGETHQI